MISTLARHTFHRMNEVIGTDPGRTGVSAEQHLHKILSSDTSYFCLPVHGHFGDGPFHAIGASGKWDMERLVAEYPGALVRSHTDMEKKRGCPWKSRHRKLLFRQAQDLFVYCDGELLIVYGANREDAEETLGHLIRKCRAHVRPPACFKVLELFGRSIKTLDVPVPSAARMSARELALHYGEGFLDWAARFIGGLDLLRNTISVLRGEPGTGKTSFLRHLIVCMNRTHRFYFVPPAEVGYLLRSDAIGFWIEESRLASNRPAVLIIEDAEQILMRRGPDNHEDISSILNLADGLLGHGLRAHVICTLNCAESDIDPAVVRPGRLLAWRSFRRLNREEAERLAGHKGLAMPEGDSCTLAELYHGNGQPLPRARSRCLGFSAATRAMSRVNGNRP